MNHIMIFLYLFICLFIVFAIGFFMFGKRDAEEYFKLSGLAGIVVFGVVSVIVYIHMNPSTSIHYQGKLVDKYVRHETETYKCGEKTCTRTVKKYHIVGQIYNKKCDLQVLSYEYHKASIGEPFTCAVNMDNYTLFNKEQYKTTEAILANTQKVERGNIYDNYHYNRVFDVTHELKEEDLFPFTMMKSNDIKVFVTESTDDFYHAVIHRFSGAGPDEILLFYGIDKNKNIIWSRLETFAKNEDNQKLVADFASSHINKTYSKQLVINDIDSLLKSYVRVSNSKFEYMKNARSVMFENVSIVIGVLLYVGWLIFLGFTWKSNRRF